MNVPTSHKHQGLLFTIFGLMFLASAAVLIAILSQLPSPSTPLPIGLERGLLGGLGITAFSLSLLMFDLAQTNRTAALSAGIVGSLCGFAFVFWTIFEHAATLGIPPPF